MSKHFWKWKKPRDETGTLGERTLYLSGTIAEESWFDDDVTPALFKSELFAERGPVTIWINSPGGDCVAAAQIYNMLIDYPGPVTVKIDGIAASAASVIAMAGTTVLMSPVATLMIHNPITVAFGDKDEMNRAIAMLAEVKESIINAYEIKTGMDRKQISRLMDAETWMNANKALELGFIDGLIEPKEVAEDDLKEIAMPEASAYSKALVANSLMEKIARRCHIEAKPEEAQVKVDDLLERLSHYETFE